MKSHVYLISRLFKQDAARWEAMKREVEEEREKRFFSYKALREAIVREMRSSGAGHRHLAKKFLAPPVNRTEAVVRKNSLKALDEFIGKVRPRLGDLQQNFMTGAQSVCHWHGHEIQGGFHFSAATRNGDKDVFIHVNASSYDQSKARDVQQRKAAIALLHIIAETKFSANRDQVWFVDLGHGRIIKPSASVIRIRQDLRLTLDHMDRIF